MAELADAQDLKSCCSDTVPVRFRSAAFTLRSVIEYVCVAQLDRALGYGPRCRGFESSRARLLEVAEMLICQCFRYFRINVFLEI